MSSTERVQKYIAHLERGAGTHGSCAAIAAEQALESAGEGKAELASINELEIAVHTLGLSVCIASLAILGALGQEIPPAPDLIEDDDEDETAAGGTGRSSPESVESKLGTNDGAPPAARSSHA